jgi:hypothetical protein
MKWPATDALLKNAALKPQLSLGNPLLIRLFQQPAKDASHANPEGLALALFPRVRKRTDSRIKAKRNRIPGCQSGKSV